MLTGFFLFFSCSSLLAQWIAPHGLYPAKLTNWGYSNFYSYLAKGENVTIWADYGSFTLTTSTTVQVQFKQTGGTTYSALTATVISANGSQARLEVTVPSSYPSGTNYEFRILVPSQSLTTNYTGYGIWINNDFTVDLGPDVHVCSGSTYSTTLSATITGAATPILSYLWIDVATGMPLSTSSTCNINTSTNMSVKLSVDDNNYVFNDDIINIVFDKPTISFSPAPVVCYGTPLVLTANMPGSCTGFTSYSWYLYSNYLGSTSTPTFTYNHPQSITTDVLNFTVTATGGGNTSSNVHTASVVNTGQPKTNVTAYICGNSTTTDINLYPDPNHTFQWYEEVPTGSYNFVPMSGQTAYNLTGIPTGRYKCYVTFTDLGITCNMWTGIFDVQQAPPLNIYSSTSTMLSSGSPSANLAITSYLSPPFPTYYDYQWYRNGVPIPGAINPTYNATVKGKYELRAKSYECPDELSNMIEVTEDCWLPYIYDYSYAWGYTIPASITLSHDMFFDNITVPNGVVLALNNCNIKMGPCATIDVQQGGQLIISSCNVSSCGNWLGIDNQGNVDITNSTIRDAFAAVYSHGTGTANINGNNFEDNDISVIIENYHTGGGTLPITNNTFQDMDMYGSTCTIPGWLTGYVGMENYINISTSQDVFLGNNNFSSPSGINDIIRGVYLFGSINIDLLSNIFYPALLNGIYADNSSYIQMVSNTFSQTKAGIRARLSPHLNINANTFSVGSNGTGILCEEVNTYQIMQNNFNAVSAGNGLGMESYNQSFLPPSSSPDCYITQNTFSDLYCGVMISPQMNPFNAGSPGNNMLASGPQSIAVICNDFNNNIFGIVGSEEIIDQHYGGGWAGNHFNNNIEWDLAWVSSTSPGYKLNYYHNGNPNEYPNNTPPNKNAITLNGLPFDVSWEPQYMNTAPGGSGYGVCIPPVPPAPAMSVKDLSKDPAISIRPNPVRSQLEIVTKYETPVSYQLTDITGKTVASGDTRNNPVLEMETLPNGVYILTFIHPDGKRSSEKVIKY